MSNSPIWPRDETLSGASISSQSGPVSDDNEGALRISQSSYITGASPSDYLVSYTGHSLRNTDTVRAFYSPSWRYIDFIPYAMVLTLCAIQTVSLRIWTCVACPFPATITITLQQWCMWVIAVRSIPANPSVDVQIPRLLSSILFV